MAESAKKVEDVTSFLKKGLSAKADVKNVMNVVSVICLRNSVFATYSNFPIPIFLQPDSEKPLKFQTEII